MKDKVTNVLIVGVGGQGTLLAGRILARAALLAGADVKMSEVHGMAQRGGSVVTQVRFGPRVYSPLIRLGEADAVLASEKLEALRLMPYLRRGGRLIVNNLAINPLPVLIKAAAYPHQEAAAISGQVENSFFIDATATAEQLGEPRAANLVLLGALAASLDLPEAAWQEAIADLIPPRLQEVNRQAFAAGRAAVKAAASE